MKIFYSLIIFSISSILTAADSRIVYKPAPDELNEKAIELIEEKFSPENSWKVVDTLFGEILFCPAGLWEQINEDVIFKNLDKGVMRSRVPKVKKNKVQKMVKRNGKVFQGIEEVEKFWIGFSNQIELRGKPKIRKLNEFERDVLWTMIAWPISEPVFICEWENHQLLLQFGTNLKIGYIDELQDYIDGDFFKK